MKEYNLKNLDIGPIIYKNNIIIGDYEINIVKNYSDLREKIIKNENCITAKVYARNERQSLLTKSGTNETDIRDLCYILSFLTGRTVHLEHDTIFFTPGQRVLSIVNYRHLEEAAQIAWENRKNFKNNEEKRPLWYYLDSIDMRIIEYFTLFGCIALEIIQRIEIDKTEYNISKELEELISDIFNLIEESDIQDRDLKSRLKGAVGHWRSPSSPEGFRLFLMKYNIIDGKKLDNVANRRIRFISQIRNDVVHGNDMSYPDWVPNDNQFDEVAFITIKFIPNLLKEYIARKFELHKFHQVKMNIKRLRSYIEMGIDSDLRMIE